MSRLLLTVVALGSLACGAPRAADRTLVVLAAEGLDPGITERLMRAGRLPHLQALAGPGGVVRVTPVPGAEPASSWATVVTGNGPGVHGIFDLVAPHRTTGRPALAPLAPRASERWFGRWWSEGSAYAPVRRGEAFWTPLGRAGIRSAVLFVPGTFPPEPVPNGILIAGQPLPDWSGAPGSSYTWLASDASPDESGHTRYGGRIVRLTFDHNVARATLIGLRAPVSVDLPVTIAHNPEARSVNVDVAGQHVYLAEGQLSRWVEVSHALSPLRLVRGLLRMFLSRAGNEVHLHVSPIHWHPEAPPSRLSSPPGTAAALFARLGPYRTLAWPGTGWAHADGLLSEEFFLDAQEETFADRAEALLNQVDSGQWDLIVAGLEPIDTATRLLWRAIDPDHPAHDPGIVRFAGAIDRMYERLDALVGDVRARLGTRGDIVVVSAYGVSPARSVVDLNRWLTEHGYLSWVTPPQPVTLAALTDAAAWPDTVDWSRTRARAMGAGRIYVSTRGRDHGGLIAPGPEHDALVAELAERLLALIDPLSGRRVVAQARTGAAAFPGTPAGPTRRPDLVVTFAPGYRMSWDSMLGGMAPDVIAPNHERWSGAHQSVDEVAVPGVWLSTLPVTTAALDAADVAPTLGAYFGHELTAGGRSRLAPGAGRQPRDAATSASRR